MVVSQAGVGVGQGVLVTTQAQGKTAEAYLKAHLNRLRAGDYFAVNAYVEMTDAHDKELQELRGPHLRRRPVPRRWCRRPVA